MSPFWSSDKPRVTKEEFKKVRGELYNYDFNQREIDWIEGFLSGDMNESLEKDMGLQGDEVDRAIGWLRANPSKHTMVPSKVDALEKVLKNRL